MIKIFMVLLPLVVDGVVGSVRVNAVVLIVEVDVVAVAVHRKIVPARDGDEIDAVAVTVHRNRTVVAGDMNVSAVVAGDSNGIASLAGHLVVRVSSRRSLRATTENGGVVRLVRGACVPRAVLVGNAPARASVRDITVQ